MRLFHKISLIIFCLMLPLSAAALSPIQNLLERIDKGASKKFVIERVQSDSDFFYIAQRGEKPLIQGNNFVSIATGINWYLKYVAGVHLCWNQMHATLPDVLPPVERPIRHATAQKQRYYLNYCTHSYSMAFWGWERWQEEIDWMALHGINMPLAITGTDAVWHAVLLRLGYTSQEAKDFIAGPAFHAWWLMNNLEGWGGPVTDKRLKESAKLQKQILKRMRELDIQPVLPGYAGTVPHDAKEKLGLNVADPGLWCSYNRPAFLQPEDSRFQEIAAIYYQELTRLYGAAPYYSMDPFHEGGNTKGVNLAKAGQAILAAMKKANPKSAWVIQSWQDNPKKALIETLPKGDVVVLDLWSESDPKWRDTEAYAHHDWLYCMLLNFGGNTGLFGKISHLINSYYQASSRSEQRPAGIGLTMEGIENNTIMYELLCELPWREAQPGVDQWIYRYVTARYGKYSPQAHQAWDLLAHSIYDCPADNRQQGERESLFCARPSDNAQSASTWSKPNDYYDGEAVIQAAHLLLDAAPELSDNDNYLYDLIDVTRQAVAERGRMVYSEMQLALKNSLPAEFRAASQKFLNLILVQDSLLGARKEFMLGNHIQLARQTAVSDQERDLREWNLRTQITTWGNRKADAAGLHDYAHKEWNGLLADFYYYRWKLWINAQQQALESGAKPAEFDFFAIEQPWATAHQAGANSQNYRTTPFPATPLFSPIDAAKRALKAIE